MTRDEAVKVINTSLELAYFDINKEALTMAIEALRQPEIIKCQDCANAAETYMKKPWIYCDAIGIIINRMNFIVHTQGGKNNESIGIIRRYAQYR